MARDRETAPPVRVGESRGAKKLERWREVLRALDKLEAELADHPTATTRARHQEVIDEHRAWAARAAEDSEPERYFVQAEKARRDGLIWAVIYILRRVNLRDKRRTAPGMDGTEHETVWGLTRRALISHLTSLGVRDPEGTVDRIEAGTIDKIIASFPRETEDSEERGAATRTATKKRGPFFVAIERFLGIRGDKGKPLSASSLDTLFGKGNRRVGIPPAKKRL